MTEAQIPFTGGGQALDVGAHVCAVHDGPERILKTLARAFEAGLERGERRVYIASEEAAQTVWLALAESGADPDGAVSRGDLVFLTRREDLLKGGEDLDPDHLLEAVKAVFGETMDGGYAGLRLSADIPRLTRNVSGGERAMEFEEKADEIINVKGAPLIAICQYRLGEPDSEKLEILERDPLTLIGGQVHVDDEYGIS